MLQLRPYQIEISEKAIKLLKKYKIVYLALEVRCGKTLIALETAKLYGVKKVLFITKLRAIKSIQADFEALNPGYDLIIINNESLHKIPDTDFDLLISDEHHRLSSFAKPNKTAKIVRERFGHIPQIYLSGTPANESGSQWYHSFWISEFSPFSNYRNFYAWAKDFVKVEKKRVGKFEANDYSKSIDEKIFAVIDPYILKYTQKEAGFESEIQETIFYVDLPENILKLTKTLLKDKVIIGKNETILCDSAVKLLSKVHQLTNGTVIFESENSAIINTYKADFIKEKFKGKKIGIFYFFKKELDLLKQVFGDNLTTDLNEFDSTDKNIALQQISGSEGISLRNADILVYYSFGYSGRQYVQGRDRMTTMERKNNNVYFIFSKGDINEKIYNVIKNKKKYNEKIFKKDFKC